jgi:hypothetical protein
LRLVVDMVSQSVISAALTTVLGDTAKTVITIVKAKKKLITFELLFIKTLLHTWKYQLINMEVSLLPRTFR